jgi:ABC-type bacteriocin/lantibiotic exporter with double-glycine peptidase domain
MTTKGQANRLVARVLKADYGESLNQPGPFLACVWIPGIGSHAVLVLSINAEGVEVIDPRFGQRQKLARTEIERQWENKIVYLEPAR